MEEPVETGRAFLLPFGHRHSLLGHPVPALEFGLPHGRLTSTPVRDRVRRTGRGFHVPHAQDTAGVGRPLHPGDSGVHTAVTNSTAAACRISATASLPARHPIPTRTVLLTRHQRGFPISRPMPSLPLTCDPQSEQEPLGFPVSFAPSRYQPRTSRWGRPLDTDPKSRRRHQPTSNQRSSLAASDFTSHVGIKQGGLLMLEQLAAAHDDPHRGRPVQIT
jgi:hypothetical protein